MQKLWREHFPSQNWLRFDNVSEVAAIANDRKQIGPKVDGEWQNSLWMGSQDLGIGDMLLYWQGRLLTRNQQLIIDSACWLVGCLISWFFCDWKLSIYVRNIVYAFVPEWMIHLWCCFTSGDKGTRPILIRSFHLQGPKDFCLILPFPIKDQGLKQEERMKGLQVDHICAFPATQGNSCGEKHL